MDIVIIPIEDLKKEMRAAFAEEIQNHVINEKQKQLFTINQVAKKLNMAHATIKKLVDNGSIKATRNGRITEEAINEFLNAD